VIARQFAHRETLRAVQAEMRIAPKQRLVVERRHVIVARVAGIAGVPHGCNDGIHFEHGTKTRASADTTVEFEQRAAAGIGDLLLVI
jgi:hypothetical protein